MNEIYQYALEAALRSQPHQGEPVDELLTRAKTIAEFLKDGSVREDHDRAS